jgi:Uncharacterized protein conserved in bacteria (DUF2252)
VVVGRTVGFDPAVCRRAALAVVGVYREQVARYAGMRLLEVWYSRVDAAEIVAMARGRRRKRRWPGAWTAPSTTPTWTPCRG